MSTLHVFFTDIRKRFKNAARSNKPRGYVLGNTTNDINNPFNRQDFITTPIKSEIIVDYECVHCKKINTIIKSTDKAFFYTSGSEENDDLRYFVIVLHTCKQCNSLNTVELHSFII